MNSLNRLPLILRKLLKKPIRFRNFSSNSVAIPEIVEETNQEKSIIVNRINSITTIGINCPEKKNSLDVATAQRLSEAIDVFEKDEEAVVGILHGYGGNFCAGFDLKEIAKYDGESEESVPQFGVLANRPSLCAKPLIACISGYAVGAGFELALMCDLRVVEENATMGIFNRRFGIPMLCGGTVRLPAMIGYARAMELILTGRGITGVEAFNWGLATQLVTCGASLGQGITLAHCIMKFPQTTLLADRASAHFGTFNAKQIDEALQFEKDNSSHLLYEEGVKGAKKFAEGVGRHGKSNHLKIINTEKFKKLNNDFL